MTDVIEVRDLPVDCVVGVYPSEAERPQPVRVTVALEVAEAGETLATSVDYARVAGEVRFLLESARFDTLEAAAGALARYLLLPATADLPHAAVEAVVIHLSKLAALGGAGTPSLRVRRTAGGSTDPVYRSARCTIRRVALTTEGPAFSPGEGPTDVLVLGSDTWLDGQHLLPGTAHTWPPGHRPGYRAGSGPQSLLVVTRPVLGAPTASPPRRYYPAEAR